MKINASTKSLVERLCDFKIYATSVLSFIGSGRAPDKATLTAENHALQCTTAGPYNAITSTLLQVGSICGLGPGVIGIFSISLAARYRIATCSTKKSVRHEGTIALFFLLSLPFGSMSFFFRPWPSTQRMHLTFLFGWTAMTRLMMCRKPKKKIATGLLLNKQDFADPFSCRASKVLRPINRHRVADILHHKKIVSRASHPGLLVDFLRIQCNGLCTARKFLAAEHNHTCRVDAQMNLTLSHITMSLQVCTTFLFLSGDMLR